MIAEAVDTARTLAVALLVWIAVLSAVATAVVYTVAVGVWWAWRGLSGAVRAAGALRALRALPESPDAPEGRVRPRMTAESPATGPSRGRGTPHGAPHDSDGAPDVSEPDRPSEARTRPSWTRKEAA